MANNCLVTKLKGVVDNNSLLKLDEVRVLVNDNQNGAGLPYVQIGFNAAEGVNLTWTGISDNVYVSLDGTNWAKSVTPTVKSGEFYYVYIKTNGDAGYVKFNNKSSISAFLTWNMNGVRGFTSFETFDLKWLKSMQFLVTNVRELEITDLPNLRSIQKPMGGAGASPVGYIFPTVSYDKSKKALLNTFCEFNYLKFSTLEQCVDYLEDSATLPHSSYQNFTAIQYEDNWNIKVGLDDERISAYKVRIYNALVALLTTLAPVVLTYVQLFDIRYTYSNGNLLADGTVVPNPNV